MHNIHRTQIAQWCNTFNRDVPSSVDINCPHCKRKVNFALGDHSLDVKRNVVAATGKCPGCRMPAYFWSVFGPELHSTDFRSVFMYPSPPIPKEPVRGTDLLPAGIQREYRAAIQVYNAEVWSAFATACRRLLEGLMTHMLPAEERARSLNIQLKALPNHVDFVEPISRLTHGIRKVGNLGAHFDEERELDRATADLLMEQVEYLLEFLFALPLRIEELEARVDRQTGVSTEMAG